MSFESLAQPPLNTSLMGVVRGVFDHYGIEAGTPWLYGATGHAFVANIHEQLCPSGPYCWRLDAWVRLLENLGVARRAFGFFGPTSTPEMRAGVEAEIREAMDAGILCSHLNMDNQLFTGYDEAGFSSTRPWGDCETTSPRLTYGTWDEYGEEIHVSFCRWERVDPADERTAIRESLEFAIDLYESPGRHTEQQYGIGPDAYRNWTTALQEGHGAGHGAWWNGTVYAECREMAAAYFREIGKRYPEVADIAADLARRYESLAAEFSRLADKDTPVGEKLPNVEVAAAMEREAVGRIPALLSALA